MYNGSEHNWTSRVCHWACLLDYILLVRTALLRPVGFMLFMQSRLNFRLFLQSKVGGTFSAGS